MINFTVEDRTTKPKGIQALHAQLPKGAIDAIAKRDGKQGGFKPEFQPLIPPDLRESRAGR